MRDAKHSGILGRLFSGWILGAVTLIVLNITVVAQEPPSARVDAQRQAMQKLAFLAGQWSGPATIMHGPGEPLHLNQSEDVQYKLGGLVMLIEGKSTDASGKVQFSALATISFDNDSKTYRFRAYNDGRYLDTALSLAGTGFSWGFTAGPADIVNTMQLTDKGEWHETTDVTVGSDQARRSMNMLLEHRR